MTGTTKIVVLGSQGGQQVTQLTGANVRCGCSVLIDVGGDLTVVDCGNGSLSRLAEAGYDVNQVRRILITHCHMDHVADLGSFVSFAWSSGRNGVDRERRIDVYGPTGILDYEAGMKQALRWSIEDQEGPLGQQPRFVDFASFHELAPPDAPTVLIDEEHLTVSTVRVRHGGMPALGFRIRTPDVDVTFSGDRGYDRDGFAAFARGTDLLFHEVIHGELVKAVLEQEATAPTFIDHLVDDHTDAPDVGRTATEAEAAALVLYHLIPGNPAIDDDQWRALVAPTYDGEIIVARDLLVL